MKKKQEKKRIEVCWIYGHDNINIVIQCKLPRFCGENPLTFSRHGGYKTWALWLEIAGLDLFINKWVMQHPYKSFIKFGTKLLSYLAEQRIHTNTQFPSHKHQSIWLRYMYVWMKCSRSYVHVYGVHKIYCTLLLI